MRWIAAYISITADRTYQHMLKVVTYDTSIVELPGPRQTLVHVKFTVYVINGTGHKIHSNLKF